MRTRLLTGVGVLIALAGGGTWLLRGDPEAARDVRVGERDPDAERSASTSNPALVGQSGQAPPDEPSPGPGATPFGAAWDAALDGASSAAEQRHARLLALMDDVRRDVAPEWWSQDHERAGLAGQDGILIARAPADVLHALRVYLEGRRSPLPAQVVSGMDADALEAAREAVRLVLRGMLARAEALGRALEAWDAGAQDEARRITTSVLADEPDNRLAKEILDKLDRASGTESEAPRVDRDRKVLLERFAMARAEPRLATWAMMQPSAATWAALRSAGGDFALGAEGRLAPEFDRMLERGPVSLVVQDEDLLTLVRRLQIESLVPLHLPPSLARSASAIRIRAIDERGASLRWILDEVVRQLPTGWRWRSERGHVLLTRAPREGEAPPEVLLHYFDVRDLLQDEGADEAK